MVAAPSLFPLQPLHDEREQRILLSNVTWKAYVALRDGVESSGVRMTYLEGQLEIMTTSREHQVTKKQIARLLELFCLERDVPLFAYGQMTHRKKKKQRGLEADECYARGKDKPTRTSPSRWWSRGRCSTTHPQLAPDQAEAAEVSPS